MTIRGSHLRAALTALPLLMGVLACANPIPPGQRRDATMDIVPIFESDRPRSQHVTYRLASMEHDSDTLVVDFDLSNGYSRSLGAVTAWVTVRGAGGERRSAPRPVGPMAPHTSRRLVVKVPDVSFEVDHVEFGAQIAP